tara:strand:+ start:2737 stop:3027 length:291 start_codon:yes stop_codon:yes gene_type:complete
MNNMEQISDKSYITTVILCGIFGMLGIHHFYIKNYAHGIFDLSIFIVGVSLFVSDTLWGVGLLLLVIDFLHTCVVTYMLITEVQHDGDGKLIVLKR